MSNDFLVTLLETIDERLLQYLDDEEQLSLDTVKRLDTYVRALLDASITPAHLMEDWPDWYTLASAFVATYCPAEVEPLEEISDFLLSTEEGENVELTRNDIAYLQALDLQLGMYPEMRSTPEE